MITLELAAGQSLLRERPERLETAPQIFQIILLLGVVEVIAADTERDNWKTAQEAKEYGLIDAVITSHSEEA